MLIGNPSLLFEVDHHWATLPPSRAPWRAEP